MTPRKLAVLLAATSYLVTSVSHAQTWGAGYYGGMQPCPYPSGPAEGSTSEDDEIAEMTRERRELMGEKREVERDLREARKQLEDYRSSIQESIVVDWQGVIFQHMEQGRDCSVCSSSSETVTQTTTQVQTTNVPSAPPQVQPPAQVPVPAPEPVRPPAPEPREEELPAPVQPPVQQPSRPPVRDPRPQSESACLKKGKGYKWKNGKCEYASNMMVNQSRLPASVSAGGELVGGRGFGDLDRPAQAGGSVSGPARGGNICNPNQEPYGRRFWNDICLPSGRFNSAIVCTDSRTSKMSQGSKAGDRAKCTTAIDKYRRAYLDVEKLESDLAKLTDQIDSRKAEIKERKREIAREDREMRRLEAECPECYANEKGRGRTGRRSSPSIAPLLVGVGAGLLAEYVGYRANKSMNRTNAELGWPAQPYMAGGYGFPFMMAGLYGYLGGGVNGAFGCGGPGFPMGPMGMMNPLGAQGGLYGQMGGQMGANPFMNPYASMMMNPLGGGMFMPGMGPWGMPGINAGIYGNLGGMPGFGGMPGLGGGLGLQMPGFGGMPGLGGGLGLQMPGFGGIPGLGGGLYGGLGIPGLGGIPGMGMDPSMQQMQLQMQMQQYQMAIEMQRRQADNAMARLRVQQGLVQEYSSLMYRFNQLNSGFGGSAGLGIDYLGGGSGLNFGGGAGLSIGGGAGLNYGGGLGLPGGGYYSSPVGAGPIYNAPIGSGTVPTRSR